LIQEEERKQSCAEKMASSRPNRRGRSLPIGPKVRLERSQQSARECRAAKEATLPVS